MEGLGIIHEHHHRCVCSISRGPGPRFRFQRIGLVQGFEYKAQKCLLV